MDQISPLSPAHPRQLTLAELQHLFPLEFSIDARTHAVHVPAAWQAARLVQIQVVPGHHVTVHRAAAPVFIEWLRRADLLGLLRCVVTVDGGFNARLKRGAHVPATEAGLSRHARGTAIDLNALLNPRGKPSPVLGEPGCLLPLVPLAYDLDIVWGGDWHGEDCDPMHFEIGASQLSTGTVRMP